MSRRRTAEENVVASDTLPAPSTDATNGKQRTASDRAGRFFRTRPVSSLLLLIGLFALAFVTYSLGRMVGRTLLYMIRANGSTVSESSMLFNRSLKSAEERGAIVDGVVGPGSASNEEARNPPSPHPIRRTCYRKFEPGRLGWEKTLCVTDEFYFDISVGSTAIGRIKIGVFGDVVPKSAANFRSLVTCSGAFSDQSLCYRGDSFHRVVTNFVIQGGSKATGRSIYGPTFKEEKTRDHHSYLSHVEKGVVSWAEYPIGSQFFILVRNEAAYLDKNHVVFGLVTDGLEVLDKIHDAPRDGEEPSSRIKISACGDAHTPVRN